MNGLGGMGLSSSGIGSWVAEASPPPKGEGWTPGQATWLRNSSMLFIGCRPKLYSLYMIIIWPLCKLCNIANKISKVKEDDPIEGAIIGAGKGEMKMGQKKLEL